MAGTPNRSTKAALANLALKDSPAKRTLAPILTTARELRGTQLRQRRDFIELSGHGLLTPFIRFSRATQTLVTGNWTLASGLGTLESQALSGFMTLQTDHLQIDAAGVYTVACECSHTVATGDHLVMLGRYNAAGTPAANGAGVLESHQVRFGPTTNTAIPGASAPFLCGAGDKLTFHTFTTNAASGTWQMSVARIGP